MDLYHLLLALAAACFLQSTTVGASTIRIAWLAPKKYYYFFNASTSLGALASALDTITADPSLLPGYDFHVKWDDSDCNSKSGIGAIFNIMTSGYDPHLILGPACSPAMDPVGQLASIHDLPVFGWISSDPILSDKTKFNTLVRLLGPITATGQGVMILLRHYLWKLVALVSTTGPDYSQLVRGIRDTLIRNTNDGFRIARWEQDVTEGGSVDYIKGILENIKPEARVVILCVPLDELRQWMLAAHDAGMTKGDYVFIYTNQIIPTEQDMATFASTSFYITGDGRDDDARQAYSNVIMMYQKTLDVNKTNEFLSKFDVAGRSGNWSNMIGVAPATPDLYSLFLYDALLVYAKLATKLGTINNGTAIFQAARDYLTTGGATGTILLGDEADRYPDYWILDMNVNAVFDVAAETDSVVNGSSVRRSVIEDRPIIWGDGTSGWANRPLDIPLCGLNAEHCDEHLVYYIVVPVVAVVVLSVLIIVLVVYRSWAREKQLNNMYWRIQYEDLKLVRGKKGFGSQSFANISKTKMDNTSFAESLRGQLFVKVATYRGRPVAVKDVMKTKVKLDRDFLEEFRMMSQVKHNNLLAFVGACVDEPNVCAVWEYCSKGSLQDVIWNENITLDDMFKFSITLDVAKGLQYLHGSGLKAHGRLKSSNVLIDGRWVCKLGDYGLRSLVGGEEEDPDSSEHVIFSRLQWTAPELLKSIPVQKMGARPVDPVSSSPGDVYAFGVLLKEVFSRNGPYTEYEAMSPQQIIEKVRGYKGEGDPFRPDLTDSLGPPALKDLIRSCWEEDPKARPPIQAALKKLTSANPFKRANVMDNMISMMEKYSNHLEDIVADRTMALEEEKKKTENLLYRMLPKSVAEDLKQGKPIQAESFDSVTIYFSDIVRFTDLAAESTPFQVVTLLNDLYTLFDSTIANHDVYKVETIGDAYMLVSGLPTRNGDRHAAEIANCSMDLLCGVLSFKVAHKPSYKMNIRIGLHTGSCVSGVVGLTMPRYCLFGDTVNTASRMESNGLAQRIHLSPSTRKALSAFSGYKLASRGGISIKGKGVMDTAWLVGHENYTKRLPDFTELSKDDNPLPNLLPQTTGNLPWKVCLPRVTSESTSQMTKNTHRHADTEDLSDSTSIDQEKANSGRLKANKVSDNASIGRHSGGQMGDNTSIGRQNGDVQTIHVGEERVQQGALSPGRLPPIPDKDKLAREGTIHAEILPPISASDQS